MPLVEARVEYEHQLYALQLVTGVLAYAYINKIKLWDKFHASRSFPGARHGQIIFWPLLSMAPCLDSAFG